MIKNETLILKYNIDTNGNPISIKVDNEQKQVSINGTIQMEFIPDEFNNIVVLDDKNKQMYEVFNRDEITTNTYYVDYNNGVMYFDKSQFGKVKIYNYYNRGLQLIGASRIYDEKSTDGETLIKTLQDIIDEGRKCLELISTLGDAVIIINKLEENILTGQVLHENLVDDITIGTPLQQSLRTDINEANTFKDQFHQDVVDGKVLSPELRKNITDGININTELQTTMTNAQADIDKINATGNKSITVGSSQFVNGEYTWVHNINSDNIIVNVIDSITKEPLMPDYKIIDKNTILLRNSTEHPNIKVMISASYYNGNSLLGTTVEEFAGDTVDGGNSYARLKDDVTGYKYPVTKTDAVYTPDGSKKLSDEINRIDASLEHISIQKTLADIQETNFSQGDSIDYSYLRTRQIKQFRNGMRKIKQLKNGTITCIGDSMTYGTDNNSDDKRTPDENICPDGSRHFENRASTTYPEALQTYLRQVYGNNISVINRGYSGDWVQRGYNRWISKHNGDITIIMYGTNDSNPNASWIPSEFRGNIDKYIEWYEQLIIREILWGKGIIVLKSPKLRYANSIEIQTFTQSLDLLCEKYGIVAIDSTEFTANISADYYSDGTHLTGEGYKLFAAKVASLFIGNDISMPKKINSGSKLLFRTQLDSCTYVGNAIMQGAINAPAPDENSLNNGLCLNMNSDGDAVIYSFYTEVDDLVVFPFYWAQNSNIRLTLDFNTIVQKTSLNNVMTDTISKEVIYNVKQPSLNDYFNSNSNLKPLIIANKGWHTLKIDKTVSGKLVFNGLYFLGYEDYKRKIEVAKLSSLPRVVRKLTHATYDTTLDVASSTFSLQDVIDSYGNFFDNYNPYKNIALKLTLNNYNDSVISYYLIVPEFDGQNYGGTLRWGEINKISYNQSPNQREVDSIIFNKIENIFTINWKGNLKLNGNFTITPM